LDEFDIDDESSEGSKFNIAVDEPSDVINKFEAIGLDYAGTGLTPSPGKLSRASAAGGNKEAADHFKIRTQNAGKQLGSASGKNNAAAAAANVDAYHAAFHGAAQVNNTEGDDSDDNVYGIAP